MKLPKFEDYSMGIPSKEVRKAYKEVEKKLWNKENVDVGDNIGYLIHFIKKRQSDFFRHLNPKQLEDDLQPILNYESDDEYFYPHLEAESCIKDSYLAVEDYDTYWDLMYKWRMDNFSNKLQKIVMFDDIYSVYKKCRNPIIDGRILIACVGVNEAKITKFGREHVEELFKVMDSYVEDFTEKEGMDPFEFFYRKYAEKPLTQEQAEELRPYIKPSRFEAVKKAYFSSLRHEEEDKKDYEEWKNTPVLKINKNDTVEMKEHKKQRNQLRESFLLEFKHRNDRLMGADSKGNAIYVPYKRFHQFINESFEGYCNVMLRTCENILRKKKNIPKIGEGWVGETTLYYLVKES